jgi:hypothetical protein
MTQTFVIEQKGRMISMFSFDVIAIKKTLKGLYTRGYSERITVNANSIEDATAQIKNRFRYWDYVSIDKAVTNRTPARPKVKVRL